jgi:hypothetical protein
VAKATTFSLAAKEEDRLYHLLEEVYAIATAQLEECAHCAALTPLLAHPRLGPVGRDQAGCRPQQGWLHHRRSTSPPKLRRDSKPREMDPRGVGEPARPIELAPR